MKKLIRHVILILITAMTVFSVIPVHAELIPRESIEYGGEVEHLGRCELNTFVAVN